jgi:hypothetical protein
MELWSPIRAHAEWIVLLRESLYGHGPLTPPMASDDDLCELGQWLGERAPLYGHLAEYRMAEQVHQAFHRRSTYCLQLATAGRRAEAIAETGENGELRRLSRQLVKTLQSLKRRVAEIEAGGSTWGVENHPG